MDNDRKMNGAESLVRTLADSGIEACFSNPGTSEMHFVAALDSEPRIRPILGLFEGAVTGMADGYGRMAVEMLVDKLMLKKNPPQAIANTELVSVNRENVEAYAKNWETWLPK